MFVPNKKVLIILSHTGSGGDSQVILNLLSEINTNTYQYFILCYQKGSYHSYFQQLAQVYTFPLDNKPFFRRIVRRVALPLFKYLKQKYCKWLIYRIKPDLIYINTVTQNEFSEAALEQSLKIITHIHELDFVVTQRMSENWIKKLLSKSQIVISPAQAGTDFYENVYNVDVSKVRLLHETVSLQRLTSNSKVNLRQILDISDDTVIVGGAGSLIYRKGVDTFINSCKIVLETMATISPSTKILFVWQGGNPEVYSKQLYYKALSCTISRLNLNNSFIFLQNTTQMASFFSGIDMFALPSRSEAFPLVVLEALLFEKPVVAMDVGGVREVIDAETGYLVKDRTPEGLAEGILHFMQSEKRRIEAGRKGRNIVLEKYEAKVQVKKWLQILENA